MAYEAEVCSSCGNLRSVCSDPNIDWHPRISTCYATASREWGDRRLAEKYKDWKSDSVHDHPLDGVTVWVSQEPPSEDEDEFS